MESLLTARGPVSAARVVASVVGAVGAADGDVGHGGGDSVGAGAVNDLTGETVDEVAQDSLQEIQYTSVMLEIESAVVVERIFSLNHY